MCQFIQTYVHVSWIEPFQWMCLCISKHPIDFWNFGHWPHFDEQLQIELSWWLMESGDPIYADTDHPQLNQTSIHASDAMLHLLQHLHEPVSANIKFYKSPINNFISVLWLLWDNKIQSLFFLASTSYSVHASIY